MLSPALLGTVAVKKTATPPPAALTLQISLDYGVTWQDGPVTDFSPYVSGGGPRSYDIRALGTGTENINVSSTNGNFFASLSSSTITGNDPLNTQLFVTYNGFGFENATITVASTAPGGDSVILYVSA